MVEFSPQVFLTINNKSERNDGGKCLSWPVTNYGPVLKHLFDSRTLRNQAHYSTMPKCKPSYANLFVGYIEHHFLNQYNGPKPKLYRRYIDDCVGATSPTRRREELNQSLTVVNSSHPALKYTSEISDTSLAFLDIKVFINGNGLCTSVHYKPTDSHSYLLHSSSQPSHVKNFMHSLSPGQTKSQVAASLGLLATPFGQALSRISCIP